MTLLRHLDPNRPQDRDGSQLRSRSTLLSIATTSADSGEDAVALFALRSPCHIVKHQGPGGRTAITVDGTQLASPQLIGRVPTASSSRHGAARAPPEAIHLGRGQGLRVGPNVNGPNPLRRTTLTTRSTASATCRHGDRHVRDPAVPDRQASSRPSAAQATDQLGRPTNFAKAPAGSPIVPPGAPGAGKIKHVFYIVRENRTYDQVLGDDPRGDGDPKLGALRLRP